MSPAENLPVPAMSHPGILVNPAVILPTGSQPREEPLGMMGHLRGASAPCPACRTAKPWETHQIRQRPLQLVLAQLAAMEIPAARGPHVMGSQDCLGWKRP